MFRFKKKYAFDAQEKKKRSATDLLFILYLVFIVWLPLPWGSNAAWAWPIAAAMPSMILVLWIILYSIDKARFPIAFLHAKAPIVLLALFTGWTFLQSIPLPGFVVQLLSPSAYDTYTHLNTHLNAEHFYLSYAPYDAWTTALKSTGLFALFIITLLLINSRDRLYKLAYTVVLSGTAQALYGAFMTISKLEYGFFEKKLFYIGVATGTFVNRNHMAGYMEICLAISIGLLISYFRPGMIETVPMRNQIRDILRWIFSRKMLIRSAIIFMVIGLVLTRSRMGNTAFLVSVTLITGLYFLIRKRRNRSMVFLFVSILVIDFLVVGQFFGIEKLKDRLQKSSIQQESRDDVTLSTIPIIKTHLLTGTGGGSFRTIYKRYQPPEVKGFYKHAHNDYAQFMVEFGAIGVSLLILLLFWSLLTAFKAYKRRQSYLMRGVAFMALMGLLSILIHSTTDFNLQIPANANMFILLMALAPISYYMRSS
ncbi:O-antigen ligase family protein [Magnetococcales bacterium HHB-1]